MSAYIKWIDTKTEFNKMPENTREELQAKKMFLISKGCPYPWGWTILWFVLIWTLLVWILLEYSLYVKYDRRLKEYDAMISDLDYKLLNKKGDK